MSISLSAHPAAASLVEPDRFKQIFRAYPGGVVVVTADSGAGPVGFTATSLSSVSLDPPLVSFGIANGSSSWPHLERAGTVVVNFLGSAQEDLARRFATSGIDRFAAPTRWHRLPQGEPALDGVTGRLRLAVEQLVPAGDAHIVVARVLEAWQSDDGRPLLFHNGSYRSL
ncbi:flavin reductase family protein [Streptomyces sp. NPDC006512]|uniref:flavin reductase family protein n=1 Tax=Streptomyces sp. NPDC006512 TaxID=3154307 RepID=UPI0033A19CD9